MKKLKVCTIGGGSSYTPELVEGFIKRHDSFPISELWLVDIEEGRTKLEIVGSLAKRMVQEAGVPIEIHLTTDREAGLRDADFVTTQIRVGFLEAREKDETIPLSHGILGQETNGAGGLFKALRTIPVLLDIAKDMERLCPDAWLINFTNPAGIVTEALLRHSNIKKVIGLCNVPIHMEKTVAKILGVEESRVYIQFAGLNHLVYGLHVYLDGEEVTARVIDDITNPEKTGNLSVSNILPVDYNDQFLKELGVLVCPYHNYYYKSDAMLNSELEELAKGNIRAQAVQKIEKELFEIYQNEAVREKPAQLEKRGGAYYSDAACRLIDSIYNDRRDIQPVNVRNNGAISGIDVDSAVEVSCLITKEGPMPLHVGQLPHAVNGLVMQIKSFERVVIEAAVEGSYEKALLALTIHPLTPSDDVAKIVVDELMEAHKAYLPQFNK